MVRSLHFNWRIILLIILLVIVGIILVFINTAYQDIKTTKQNVTNLYQEIKSTNQKIDKFSSTDDDAVQNSIKFTEATRNWLIYQNDEFHFQLKNPVSWGNLDFNLPEGLGKVKGQSLSANFSKLPVEQQLNITITSYDYARPGLYSLYASQDIRNQMEAQTVGECTNALFEKIKALEIGEIRNCFVKENILNQKYLVYRNVMKSGDKTIETLRAVYPEDKYYMMIELPSEVAPEVDYFVESIVFLY